MLDFMRRNARSTLIKIIFVIIIAVFILWGAQSYREGGAVSAATINGERISPKQLAVYARQLEGFYKQMYGEKYTPDMAKALDIRNRALDQLINRALLRQEAKRLGFSTSDADVRDAIAAVDGFRVDGKFRRDVYFRFVRSQGMTPAEFEDQQRDDLLVRQIQNLYESVIPVDETTGRALFAFSNEKTNLAFLELDTAGYRKDVKITAEEAQAYYEKVKESFREPTRVEVELIAYPTEHFVASAAVSDEEVKTEYELRKDDRYTMQEEVHARHILVRSGDDADEAAKKAARERAETALARIKKGEDFAAVAKEMSDDLANKEEGGDLGFFPRGRMDEAFEKAAFSLEPGALSDVLETSFGFHVIRVEEKRAQRTKTIDEVREEIVERLKGEKSEGLARDAAYEDAAAAKTQKPLADLAEARGLEVQTPSPFAESESIAGMPPLPKLVAAAFAASAGEVADVVEGPGVFYVVRVKQKIASHVPPFEQIKGRVESNLIDGRAADAAREHGERIHKQLLEGKTIADVAAAEGLKLEETGPFSRGGEYVPKIGGVVGLTDQAFQLTKEKPVAPEVYVTSRAAYVVALKERLPADFKEFEEKKQETLLRYSAAQQRTALDLLIQNLKKSATIHIDPSAFAPA